MKRFVIRLCFGLLRWLTKGTVIVLPSDAVIRHARELRHQEDARCAPGTSGEYKRHQVYAALQKRFPDVPKRELALAIELAS